MALTRVDLCDPECEGVVLPALPARDAPRTNDEGPHAALGVRREASAYLTLDEAGELVDRTLQHLRRLHEARGPIFGTGFPMRVPLAWSQSTARHGVCKMKPGPLIPGMKRTWSFSIEFSKPVFEHTNLEGRYTTVIHEACHVVATLLGDRGHGTWWKDCMRACGLRPDVKAESIAALAPHLVCQKCSRTSSVSLPTASRIAKGTSGGVVCPGCGTVMDVAQLVVPEKLARRVATAAAKIVTHVCACGTKISLTPKHIRAMARGATYRCTKCGKGIEVIGVLPAGGRP